MIQLTGVVRSKDAIKIHNAVGSLNPFTVRKDTIHGRIEWPPLTLILCRLSCEPCDKPGWFHVKAGIDAMENIFPHGDYLAAAYTCTKSWGWSHQLKITE